jgi:hypothetical protein
MNTDELDKLDELITKVKASPTEQQSLHKKRLSIGPAPVVKIPTFRGFSGVVGDIGLRSAFLRCS